MIFGQCCLPCSAEQTFFSGLLTLPGLDGYHRFVESQSSGPKTRWSLDKSENSSTRAYLLSNPKASLWITVKRLDPSSQSDPDLALKSYETALSSRLKGNGQKPSPARKANWSGGKALVVGVDGFSTDYDCQLLCLVPLATPNRDGAFLVSVVSSKVSRSEGQRLVESFLKGAKLKS